MGKRAPKGVRIALARHSVLVKTGRWATAPDASLNRNPCATCQQPRRLEKRDGQWCLLCPQCEPTIG